MTPKEKAHELRDKFHAIHFMSLEMAKESALITVDEILEHCYEVMKRFWKEVKQEIEKL